MNREFTSGSLPEVREEAKPGPAAPAANAGEGWAPAYCRRLEPGPRAMVERALERARQAHAGQTRASGEPYFGHVLAVAELVAGLGLDHETVCAALLHDVVEDTGVTLAELEEEFGPTVARLVDGVTKMGLMGSCPNADEARSRQQAESLRKMLLAMVEDIRVVLIKLADRLHNMRTLRYLSPDRQQRIARETMDVFAPLANRLGIWQIKWELEDLALRYLEPLEYQRIARLLDERRAEREERVQTVVRQLERELRRAGLPAEVSGRPKHIYSIWKKMQRKGVGFNEIYDVHAVRILVQDVAACYAALGVVHTLWRHIPKEFDDYIANPKENNYQSLHTAVIGPHGRPLEVQIRTWEMHEHAELGVAAHWAYKEGGDGGGDLAQKINWLRQLLEWREEERDAGDFVRRFQSEVFQDRVYVLTPRGNVIDLPAGATPLDFAYYIHTDVGHRCRGAKVDGSIVPLTHELRTGEQVEVLTGRLPRPSRDWLNPHLGYLRTSRARAKVRAWFRQQDLDRNISEGRIIVDRELRRLGIGDLALNDLARRFGFEQVDDLFAAAGRGEIGPTQLAGAARERVMPATPPAAVPPPQRRRPARSGEGAIRIHGVGNLLSTIAGCCKPVPWDPIVGYITRGRGVSIHRQDCPNALRLQQESRERLIEVSWSDGSDATYPVDVGLLAYDRRGLLRDITAVLSNERINVLAMTTRTDEKDQIARIRVTLEIKDIDQLSRVLGRLGQIPNVAEVSRLGSKGEGNG